MAKIVLLSGDGIGPELMRQAEKVLCVLKKNGLDIAWEHALLGGCAVDETGSPYPDETREKVQRADAVLLAAVGGPKWDGLDRAMRPETGLLAIRKDLGLFANLRPIKVFPALADRSTLKMEVVSGLDVLIVRELTGGIYFGQPRGMRTNALGAREGFNTMHYDAVEVSRIAKVAFAAAQKRQGKVCSVDKMNVLETSQLWREEVIRVSEHYPDVSLSHMLVDNAAMQLVRAPKQFDVIVTGNLFGDILSDEASMLTGSIGLLPSASLREDGFGLYEPIHGSAPDIAGQNKANPIAMILSVAMMLRHSFAEHRYAEQIEQAVESVLNQGMRTGDIANTGDTVVGCNEMGDLVVAELKHFMVR